MKLDWIPQLFKDLIGRIVPGATVLLAACIVWAGHFSALRSVLVPKDDESILELLLIGLVITYIIGYSLSQVWGMTFGQLRPDEPDEYIKPPPGVVATCKERRLNEHNKLQKNLGRTCPLVDPKELPSLFAMHDHIRITLPQEANRLSKMQSEIRLCRSLIVGIGILCAANLWFFFHEPTVARFVIEVVMTAIVWSAWRREINLHTFLCNGICVIWLCLVSTDQLFRIPK